MNEDSETILPLQAENQSCTQQFPSASCCHPTLSDDATIPRRDELSTRCRSLAPVAAWKLLMFHRSDVAWCYCLRRIKVKLSFLRNPLRLELYNALRSAEILFKYIWNCKDIENLNPSIFLFQEKQTSKWKQRAEQLNSITRVMRRHRRTRSWRPQWWHFRAPASSFESRQNQITKSVQTYQVTFFITKQQSCLQELCKSVLKHPQPRTFELLLRASYKVFHSSIENRRHRWDLSVLPNLVETLPTVYESFPLSKRRRLTELCKFLQCDISLACQECCTKICSHSER